MTFSPVHNTLIAASSESSPNPSTFCACLLVDRDVKSAIDKNFIDYLVELWRESIETLSRTTILYDLAVIRLGQPARQAREQKQAQELDSTIMMVSKPVIQDTGEGCDDWQDNFENEVLLRAVPKCACLAAKYH